MILVVMDTKAGRIARYVKEEKTKLRRTHQAQTPGFTPVTFTYEFVRNFIVTPPAEFKV